MNLESIKYSLRNLNHRKGRSSLTIFSILIGIMTIFIFISFGYGLYNYTNELTSSSSADKIIIQSKGGTSGLDDTFKLTDDDLEVVRGTAGVLEATGAYFKSAEVSFNNEKKYTLLFAYDSKTPMVIDVFGIEIEQGRELKPGDSKQVVLGSNYKIKDKIFSKPVELNNNIKINDVDFKVVGFYESIGSPQDDAQVYITDDYLDELYENNSYGWIVAKVDVAKMSDTIERVEKNLRKERGFEKGKEDFYVQSFEDLMNSYTSVLNIIVGFVILIALISVVVSAVNTANTMITSVLERYKEIGILKAIGARNSEIFKIFLFESSFLGFVAGCLGVLLGWIVTFVAGIILENLGWGFLQPFYSPMLFIGCVLFATITGAVSGVAPAIRASRINPVDALRYEWFIINMFSQNLFWAWGMNRINV